MDDPADWAASALFSPSKAKAQQARARDWAAVDAWLVRKYGDNAPVFERNEATLGALMELAAFNDDRDESQALLDRVAKSCHQMLSRNGIAKTENEFFGNCIHGIDEELLDSLARTELLLGTSQMSTMAGDAQYLTAQVYAEQQTLLHCQTQQATVVQERVRLESILTELSSDDFKIPEDYAGKTQANVRNAKQLRSKISEYEDRLAGSQGPHTERHSLSGLIAHEDRLAKEQSRMQEALSELAATKDFPTDKAAAGRTLDTTKDELRALLVERDRLFEGMVNG